MPLTFIDIEKQKNWRIWVFFLLLLLLYVFVCLAFAAPFLPHAVIFSQASGIVRFLTSVFIIAFLIAGIHFFFAGYNAVGSIVSNLDAQPPDPNDDVHKTLLNIMQEIHVATGDRRKIQCVVIPTLSLNALAAADLKGKAVIGITEGLLSRLKRPQLEAVIAHETHHIHSGDCLETTVAASLFAFPASLLDRYSETSGGRHFPHPFLWPAWVLLKLSILLNLFISREREYRADAAAVRMTRNPIALAETLHLLSRNWRGAGFIGSNYEMMCIVNPEATELDEAEGLWADLFSTHPPIAKRIDLLLSMAHVNISELDTKAKSSEDNTLPPGRPAYYAMSPRQQWQGPFTLAELEKLPWLSALTWITTGKQQPVDRAWKEPLVNAIFAARLSCDRDTSSDNTCPVCSQPLFREGYEGTQVYQCRSCAGTLVEYDKIPRILARTNRERSCTERINALARAVIQDNQLRNTRQKLSDLGARRTFPSLSCPQCKNPMLRAFFSVAYEIEIDRCSFCSIMWFDQDELEMLQCLIENRIMPDIAEPVHVGRSTL